MKSFTLTRVFDAPVERVWAAWSEPELVKQWWGPLGYTCPVARMDLRKGGVSVVCMRSPEGFEIWGSWTYVRVEPTRLFDYRFNLADKDGNAVDPMSLGMPPDFPRNALHQVRLNRSGAQTDLVMTEHGYLSDALMELSRRGLSECFDKMAVAIAG